MNVDSDDYIETDACEKLISFAEDDIDVVIGVCKEIKSHWYVSGPKMLLTFGASYLYAIFLKWGLITSESLG